MSEIAPQAPMAPEVSAPTAAPVEGQAPAPKEDNDLAARFAALARRENEVRNLEKGVKDREKSLTQKETELKSIEKKYSREEILANPAAFFQQTGMTVEQFLDAHLAVAEGKQPSRQLDREIDELKAQIKERDEQIAKEKQERESSETTAKIAAYKEHMKNFLSSEKEKESFELVNLYGEEAMDLVYDVVTAYYEEHGEMIDPKDGMNTIRVAAQQVEDHYAGYIEKGRAAKRFVPKEEPKVDPPAAPAKAVTERPVPQPSHPTLSSQTPALSSIKTEGAGTLLSREESLKRATAKLVFK